AIHDFALSFPDYREAVDAGAIREAADVAELAKIMNVPAAALAQSLADVEACRGGARQDPFGRDFSTLPPLQGPWRAVRVTGALFHTQGGLMIDASARVVDGNGTAFPNLFAGGGAACGVSGPDNYGYLSGNGLLTAISFGWIAGNAAALSARD